LDPGVGIWRQSMAHGAGFTMFRGAFGVSKIRGRTRFVTSGGTRVRE
jgi:hypothetical protein